jgi:hypothetical protein
MKPGLRKTAIGILGTLTLAAIVLAACGTTATPTAASLAEAYVSTNLPTTYEGALPAATQLVLGTFLLEGTSNAVTPDQAKTLLPLWQALQNGAVQGTTEVNAVLGQIERAMTAEQVQAIAALQLTQENMAAWAQERGINLAQGPGMPGGTPGAGRGGTPGAWPRGTPGAGGQGDFNPEARETMRAGFDSMSDEERAQLMATMQAGGMPAGGPGGGFSGRGGNDMGEFRFLLPPLIELLTQRVGSP